MCAQDGTPLSSRLVREMHNFQIAKRQPDLRFGIILLAIPSLMRIASFCQRARRIHVPRYANRLCIAGFRDEEVAPLLTDAIDVEDIILPKEFVEKQLPNYQQIGRQCLFQRMAILLHFAFSDR